MKKSVLLVGSIAIVFLLSSCGGPKADAKKMLKLFKDYTEVAVNASTDKVLNESEIKELNKISNEIEDFSQELDEKYKSNTEAQKEMQEYMKESNNIKVMNDYTNALMSLWSCEGAENLE